MKKVAILTNYKNIFTFTSDVYKKSSIEMKNVFYKNNIEVVRVSMDHYDKEKKSFNEYVNFDENWEIIIVKKEYIPEIIWKRTKKWNLYNNEILKSFVQFPSFKIIEIWRNKYEMYLFLKEFMPNTLLLSVFFKWNEEIYNNVSDKVVLKPINSNWWSGIEFMTKQELLNRQENYPWLGSLYIVQDFKDLSKWYNEIITWIHDVRLVFVWWKFSYSIVRTPKEWDLKCNVWSWWNRFSLSYEQVPKELFEISKLAIKNLEPVDEDIFSIDFAYCKDENKWYILEINCSPGIWFLENEKEYQVKYFNDLSNLFNWTI